MDHWWFMGDSQLPTHFSKHQMKHCKTFRMQTWFHQPLTVLTSQPSVPFPGLPGLPGQDSVLLGLCLFLVIFQQIPARAQWSAIIKYLPIYRHIQINHDKSTMISFLSTCYESYLRPNINGKQQDQATSPAWWAEWPQGMWVNSAYWAIDGPFQSSIGGVFPC